jgi:hypothetical protein
MCKGLLKSPFSYYSRAAPHLPSGFGAIKDHHDGTLTARKLVLKPAAKISELCIGHSRIHGDHPSFASRK